MLTSAKQNCLCIFIQHAVHHSFEFYTDAGFLLLEKKISMAILAMLWICYAITIRAKQIDTLDLLDLGHYRNTRTCVHTRLCARAHTHTHTYTHNIFKSFLTIWIFVKDMKFNILQQLLFLYINSGN